MKRRGSVVPILTCLLFVSSLLHNPEARAQSDPPYETRLYNTQHCGETPPRIDGTLDDACWNRVEWAGDFLQWEPTEGQPPSQRTQFKILYDASALYVAYRAYDDDASLIECQLARRDWFPGDWVEINIDSHLDRRTAYSFTSSVSGVRGDEFISQDGNHWDGNWDPIWQLETRTDSAGWTAELMIPLSQLRYSSKEEHVWGIQVQRRVFREEERSLWQPKRKNEPGWVSRFGELHGIRGLGTQRQVELLPYTVAQGERFESVPGDPFRDGGDGKLSAGIDGKVGVTSALTMDFTINPDFGQVEADPSEVNLSAFETFFDEKRPFFIEGRNIFDFQIAPAISGGSFTRDNLFYSRRVGRQPSHYPSLDGPEHADVPANSSILGAFKLSGKTASGLSIGVLESVTAREEARIEAPGFERRQTVEPLTNFFVGRLQQDLNNANTRVGGIFTSNHRSIDDDDLDFLHTAAIAGGADFVHEWQDKTWNVALNAVMSHVRGDEEALLVTQRSSARYFQRPDNDYESVDSTRTALTGHAGSFRFGRRGGGNLRFETGIAWRSPGFEINDIGFLRRADELNQFGWAGYSINNPFSIFRRLSVNFNQWADWDFGGNPLVQQLNTNFNTNFKNNWSTGGGVTRTLERVSNTDLRGGPSSTWPGEWNSSFWVNSDRRQRVSIDFGADFSDGDENSAEFRSVWAGFGCRPSNAVTLAVNPSFKSFKDELQFVGKDAFQGEDRFLFGSLEQKTADLTLRVDYSLTPNLTMQFYGAPFVSSGAYTQFKRITDPRAGRYRDRFHTFSAAEITYDSNAGGYNVDEDRNSETDYEIDNPDFNVRDFNSNLVVRWEFQPGSTMFLVWNQSRSDQVPKGRFALRNDVDGLFGVHPHNVFLVKVNKWFSL